MTTSPEAARRHDPRPWDTDWLMLRGLTRTFEEMFRRSVARRAQVLDFGCGAMPYRAFVEQHGAEYVGADFEAGAMVRIDADGRLPVADDSMDAVISVQVLEHVRDLDLYLNEAARVLKKDGVLLLSTHGTWLYHPHPEDHRRWTRTGLVHDVETRGFRVREIDSIVGHPRNHDFAQVDRLCFLSPPAAACRPWSGQGAGGRHERSGLARR